MEYANGAGTTPAHTRHRRKALRTRRSVRGFSTLSLAVFGLSILLGACAPAASQTAQQNKARLDKELTTARTTAGVPDALLQPIITQENSLAAGTKGGSDQSYQAAATGYTALYNKVVSIEKMTPTQARAQTNTDFQTLTTAVTGITTQGFVKAPDYAQQLAQAQQQFSTAKTTKDYFKVDGQVLDQIAAVHGLTSTYQQMETLNALVDAQNKTFGIVSAAPQPLQCAREASDSVTSFWYDDPIVTVTPQQNGPTPSYTFQQWPSQNLELFRAASTAQQFDALSALMRAQTLQLSADTATLLPTVALRQLQAFQTDIQTYLTNGGTDTSYQQQAAQDAQTLSKAKSAADYNALIVTLKKQTDAFTLASLKVQAQHDFAALKTLVDQSQSKVDIDPANGQPYATAYEYVNSGVGIGDVQERLANAQTLEDYQAVEREIDMFTVNLQAMMANINDTTPFDQPHQTDLTLLQHYGITNTNVMVVSLGEQVARFYENGQLVKAMKVTTGNPDLPSPPGLHCIYEKMSNYDDISPYPKDSPYYYNPTHINFGMRYSDYGFLIHDAWWRSWFGKYSNLPHYDPISFNNGSHGCINTNLDDMTWIYNWTQIGTPVLVY